MELKPENFIYIFIFYIEYISVKDYRKHRREGWKVQERGGNCAWRNHKDILVGTFSQSCIIQLQHNPTRFM